MRLTELDDAIDLSAYHDKLNPKLWADGRLHPEVRAAMLKIAKAFYEFVGVTMPVLDITFTGSNAAFNYTDFSDIDIHIITRYDDVGATADNLFSTKKALWSNTHDIKIKGYAVELYVEDEKNPVTALGVWSLRRNKWVNMPSYRTPDVDDSVIRAKVEELEFEINDYLKSDDVDSGEITKLIDKLKTMRKAGLAKGGEFSVENLAFKAIRNAGYIDKLLKARLHADDVKLTLETLREGYDEEDATGPHLDRLVRVT